jgi:hypothetical protein
MTRIWRSTMVAACLVVAQAQGQGQAGELSLQGLYQRPDGAITVRLNGDTIDPYFATKALLAAADAQFDARAASQAWIAWLLPMQRADGGFDRYCVKAGEYSSCATADADDAMMAVWMELLTRFAPADGMPAEWKTSLAKAEAYLARLYDKQTGVYQISTTLPVALFMDNVEVYSAFRAVADYRARTGDRAAAERGRQQANQLARQIVGTFWSPQRGFRSSTQIVNDSEFYPTAVAQLFPLMSGMPTPNKTDAATYSQWMHKNCRTWLGQPANDFPWGLVALAAYKTGDQQTVACWHASSAPYRHGVHWNVLEETLYLAFEDRMDSPVAPVQCCPS